MILKRMTLTNFRQFAGVQNITFGQNDSNVTVLYGENGRGKTSLFRAVMFGLFGERKLSQDGAVSEKEINLVSLHALHQDDKPVTTTVEIELMHGNCDFIITRKLIGMRQGDKILEELSECKLIRKDQKGNSKVIDDPDDILLNIQGILDSRVKEYFLFDGEKIEQLTRADVEQRKVIAKGIRNLLNVDALEKAIDITGKLRRNLNKELESTATGDLAKLIRSLNENRDRQDEISKSLESSEEEIDNGALEIRRLDKELQQYNEIKHFIESRKQAEKDKADKEEELMGLLAEMRTITGTTSFLLVEDVIDTVAKDIDRRIKKGEIPPEMRADFVESLLVEGKCICGRPIKQGSHEYNEISQWKTKVSGPSTSNHILELHTTLTGLCARCKDFGFKFETYAQKYALAKHDFERSTDRISDLQEKIGTSERKDAVHFEVLREKSIAHLAEIKAKKIRLDEELAFLKEEEQRITIEKQAKEREVGFINELTQRSKLVEDTHNALHSIFNRFAEEIKVKIGESASSFFQNFLDEQGKRNLSRIVVNSDYSLQVIDRWENPFLANISAGQRQIMSISFIAALAMAAAGGNILEMPFFMDTPFGRLSDSHRKNLIAKLPELCSQWILLATDTEFRITEASLLKDSGKWGRFYQLKSEPDGSTKIKERDIEEYRTILKERK